MSPRKKTQPTPEEPDPRIKEIIVAQLGCDPEEINLDSNFVDDLGCDSLDTIELTMAFEEAYSIMVPDEDAEKIRTVGDAQAYIRKATAPQGEIGKTDS